MRISSPPLESLTWLTAVESFFGQPWRDALGDRTPITSVEDAVAAVRAAKTTGVDLIKIRNILPSEGGILRAVLEEANRLNIPVSGHAPQGRYMNADVFNAEAKDRLGTAGRGFASLEHFDSLNFGSMDDPMRTTVLERMRDAGVMVTATTPAIRSRLADRAELQRMAADDGTLLPDVSPRLRSEWLKQLGWPVQDFDWTGMLARADQDARLAYVTGVDILAGSDFGVPGLTPGQVLHDELAIMVAEFGMTPADALKTATVNPAKFWNQEDEFGQVAVGLRADLIILDANPLSDITATRRISGLVQRGEYFDAQSLNRLRSETRRVMQGGGSCARKSSIV
jgi:imidazolonepropionase-like amidohydrolase